MRDLMRCVTIPLGSNTKGHCTLSVKLSDFTLCVVKLYDKVE